MKKNKTSVSGSIYLVIMLIFLYAPIVLLILYSFNEGKSMSHWTGFSLKWYVELFKDRDMMQAVSVTISVAVLSALFATIIGTFAAIGIHSMKKKNRSIIMGITNLPVVNPDIVTGISLMLIFTFLNIPLGYTTLLLSHITFNIPYVILAVMPKLKQSSNALYEAALDLGASPFYALRRIVIPDIMPGIITGAILAFTLSLDDFVISFFTRQKIQNISIIIYSMARTGIKPKINALSAIMFVVVLALLLLVNLRSNDNKKNNHKKAKA